MKDFCVKRDEDNPLWVDFVNWIIDKSNHDYWDWFNEYHGIFEGKFYSSNKVWKTEITIEEWHKEYFVTKNNDFITITNSIASLLEHKNKNYGNAALQPLYIFAKHHNYGSRIDEKLARVKNSEELRKNDVADIIGGLILICKDKGWNNFDDLKD